ncbi:MAG: hypothetical protein WBN39_05055 [Flavobacteriaceae bacterium]
MRNMNPTTTRLALGLTLTAITVCIAYSIAHENIFVDRLLVSTSILSFIILIRSLEKK